MPNSIYKPHEGLKISISIQKQGFKGRYDIIQDSYIVENGNIICRDVVTLFEADNFLSADSYFKKLFSNLLASRMWRLNSLMHGMGLSSALWEPGFNFSQIFTPQKEEDL